MYFAGTDCIIKLINTPFPVPVISDTFTFPASRLRIRIEEGILMYNTFDGANSISPSGFCSDPQYKTKSDCLTVGINTEWTVYATIGNADDTATINLNATQLMTALDDMYDYFDARAVNNSDLIALQNWITDIKTKANKQATWQEGIDTNAKLVDAVGLQINSQQPVSPSYSPFNHYMETYMRSNTMIQGSLAVNYSSDDRHPAHTYFKGKPLDNFQSMISTLSFMNDKAMAALINDNARHQRLNRTNPLTLELTYLRDDWERYLALNTDEFMLSQGTTSIQLHDVRFISRNHAVSPSAENIVESYQFIARELV